MRYQFPACAMVLCLLTGLAACKKSKKIVEDPDPCPTIALTPQVKAGTKACTFTYRTAGGGRISIYESQIILSHDDYERFKIEFWGTVLESKKVHSGNHENLNGKHVKDRIGTRRTIVFPDGAKITMVAEGMHEKLLSLSIYDAGANYHIIPKQHENVLNVLNRSSVSSAVSKKSDDEEADGECGAIEFTPTGLLFLNIYTEDTPGSKIHNRVKLGEIFRDNPSQVNDYYDDPRLGHT